MNAQKSSLRVILIDETDSWSDEIQSQVESIKTAYLYDLAVVTHCCSIKPSNWCEPLYYVVEGTDDEKLLEIIHNTFDEVENEGRYYDLVPLADREEVKVESCDFEFEEADSEEYREGFEKAKEYCQCNHQI